MLREFREFAVRGNVVDIAVGLVIGAAFGAIVTSLVSDVIMPPIGLLLGGVDFSNRFLVLKEGATQPAPYASLEDAKAAAAVTVNIVLFQKTVVGFLLITFAMYLVLKSVNRLRREEPAAAPAPPEPTPKEKLLAGIHDLLKASAAR